MVGIGRWAFAWCPDRGPGDRRLATALLFLLVALSTSACTERPDGVGGAVYHPIPDSLSADPRDAVSVGQVDPGSGPASVRDLAHRLAHRSVVATVGEMEGAPEEVLGRVTDALFLPDGSIALADGQSAVVHVLDSIGEYRDSMGGPGEGPGEFSYPAGLILAGPSSLWVVDARRGVQRFEEEESGWVFRDRLPVEVLPQEGCGGDDRSVVLQVSLQPPERGEAGTGPVLRVVDASGEELLRFAQPYRYGDPVVAYRMNQGVTACGPDDMVLYGLNAMNRLDAYQDGALLWHASFEGVQVPAIEETRDPERGTAVRFQRPEDAAVHRLVNVAVHHESEAAVVQFEGRSTRDMEEGIDRPFMESFLVDLRSGEGAYLGQDLPQVLAIEGSRALLLRNDPFPQIEVVELGPRLPSG